MSDDENPPRAPAAPMKVLGTLVTIALLAVAAWRFRPRATPAPEARDAAVALARDAAVVDAPVTEDIPDAGPADDVPAATPAELALFAPLVPGAPLGDAQIERISRVVDGRILVDVRRGAVRVTFGVMLHRPEASQLVRAGRYVVYVHSAADPVFYPLAPRIAAALELHQDVAVPAGLRPVELTGTVADAGL